MNLLEQYLDALRKITVRAIKPTIAEIQEIEKKTDVWPDTINLAIILYVACFIEGDKKVARKEIKAQSQQILRKIKNKIWLMYSIKQNKRNLAKLLDLLEKRYQVKPGALLTTKKVLTFQDSLSQNSDTERTNLELEQEYVLLFLGVETDPKYDTLALKLLSENRILYFHKRETLGWFIKNFDECFQLAQRASNDQF